MLRAPAATCRSHHGPCQPHHDDLLQDVRQLAGRGRHGQTVGACQLRCGSGRRNHRPSTLLLTRSTRPAAVAAGLPFSFSDNLSDFGRGRPVIFIDSNTAQSIEHIRLQDELLCDGLTLNAGDACLFSCTSLLCAAGDNQAAHGNAGGDQLRGRSHDWMKLSSVASALSTSSSASCTTRTAAASTTIPTTTASSTRQP